MIVKPFGMENSDKHKHLFDPVKSVTICYWGMDKFGGRIFSQSRGDRMAWWRC